MANAEGTRERPGMAGVVPQRARTAGLKRRGTPGVRDGPRFPQVQTSAIACD